MPIIHNITDNCQIAGGIILFYNMKCLGNFFVIFLVTMKM